MNRSLVLMMGSKLDRPAAGAGDKLGPGDGKGRGIANGRLLLRGRRKPHCSDASVGEIDSPDLEGDLQIHRRLQILRRSETHGNYFRGRLELQPTRLEG